MKGLLQKVVLSLTVGFCVFYLVTRPEDSANAVSGFFGAFDSVVRFFNTLATA